MKAMENNNKNEINCTPPDIDGRVVIADGVTEVPTFAYAENRSITQVIFPESVEKIGAHAFYNCRSLHSIRIENCDVDIGDGAFKNCERLTEIIMRKNAEGLKSLKSILFDAHRQVAVRLIYPDGEACLIFPYYIDNFEENTPARIVMHISEGSGTMYRECIYSGDVDYKAYDALFATGRNIDIFDASADIAIKRLKYPYRLSEIAQSRYEEFLKANVTKIAESMIKSKKTIELDELMSLGIFEGAELKEIMEIARSADESGALAVCLKYFGERRESKKDRYVF